MWWNKSAFQLRAEVMSGGHSFTWTVIYEMVGILGNNAVSVYSIPVAYLVGFLPHTFKLVMCLTATGKGLKGYNKFVDFANTQLLQRSGLCY